MAHSRIVEVEYIEDPGMCAVVKSSKWGLGTGTAFCCEEDQDVRSEYTGGAIAEYRADTEIAHKRATELAARARGMEHLKNVLMKHINEFDTSKRSDETISIMSVLYRQLNVAKRDAKIAHNQYMMMKKYDRGYANRLVEKKREFRKNHPTEN